MHSNMRFGLVASLASFISLVSATLPVINVESQDFVDSKSGKRFEIIGVDYQPGGSSGYNPTSGIDPLSNPEQCLRDAAMMQTVGFNTIRTYNVDPKLNHDECMSIFDAAGIYLVLDVNSPLPNGSIDEDDPSSTYSLEYLKHIFSVVDAFSGYPNLIGFFSANELINTWPQSKTNAPYIRAVTRDLKQYIAAQAPRTLAVGYSSTDFAPALVDEENYLQCIIQDGPDSRSDFFALNSYSWCGNSSYTISGYNVLTKTFAAVTMPTFFSEYGCNMPSPRYFTEVPVLYGPKMTPLSGGLVYEWTQEANDFGLIDHGSDGSVKETFDLYNLMKQFNTLNLNLLQAQNATARNLKPPTCSASIIKNKKFSTSFDLPTAPSGTEELIQKGAGGNKGKLVAVTKTSIDVVLTLYGGSTTSGLTVTPVTTGNLPGRTWGAAAAQTTGSSGPSDSSSGHKTGAAPGMARSVQGNPAPYMAFSMASVLLWLLG